MIRGRWLVTLFLVLIAALPGLAQEPSPALADLTGLLEQETATLESILSVLEQDPVGPEVDAKLPDLRRQIDARLEETAHLLAARPTLDEVRDFERGWRELGAPLAGWKQRLSQRVETFTQLGQQLQEIEKRWKEARDQSPALPEPILERIQALLTQVEQTAGQIEQECSESLTLLNSVSEQNTRIDTILKSLSQARSDTVYRLLEADSPPVWDLRELSLDATLARLENQLVELGAYLDRMASSFQLHFLLIIALWLGFLWAGRRIEPMVAAEPGLSQDGQIFRAPLASALLLSVLLARWLRLYVQAPAMVKAMLGSAAILPALILLRRLLSKRMLPVIYGLACFYLVGMVRLLLPTGPPARLLFLGEMLAGVLGTLWLLSRPHFPGRLRVLARLAAGAFSLSLLAGMAGFMRLAQLLGDTVLQSSYLAVFLYVMLQVLDSLILFALRSDPLNRLGVVKRHRTAGRTAVMRVLDFLAVLAWIAFVLDSLSLLQPGLKLLRTALSARFSLGSLGVSPGEVLAFGLAIWLAFQLSRLVRATLEEDVYPRVSLPRGIPYALSMVAHYMVLLLGFLLGISALGLDLGRFAIIGGAFGVGLGLGLQSIVNNFVSGLILLFERPVQVDDAVQVGSFAGTLKEIGLRASVVRGWDGSEAIIPNGELISATVTNFSPRDGQRRIEILLGVKFGSRPRDVTELLEKVAGENPDILDEPAPYALFLGFGTSSLDFSLRCWTDHADRLLSIKSELGMRVYEELQQAGIEIALPQQTVLLERS